MDALGRTEARRQPLLGWRAWAVRSQSVPRGHPLFPVRFSLLPVTRPRPLEEWPSMDPLLASCRVGEDHAAPDSGCRCGIYAFRNSDDLMDQVEERGDPGVLGTVALWGKVVVGTRGYRAQYAYPQCLWVARGLRPHLSNESVISGLRRYGVPVNEWGVKRRRGYRRGDRDNPDRAP